MASFCLSSIKHISLVKEEYYLHCPESFHTIFVFAGAPTLNNLDPYSDVSWDFTVCVQIKSQCLADIFLLPQRFIMHFFISSSSVIWFHHLMILCCFFYAISFATTCSLIENGNLYNFQDLGFANT